MNYPLPQELKIEVSVNYFTVPQYSFEVEAYPYDYPRLSLGTLEPTEMNLTFFVRANERWEARRSAREQHKQTRMQRKIEAKQAKVEARNRYRAARRDQNNQ